MNKSTIKIISCTDHLMWYFDCIGKEYRLISEEHDIFWVRDKDKRKNIVYKKDAL